MKIIEIGHFPHRPPVSDFDGKNEYPPLELSWEGDKAVWTSRFKILGEIPVLDMAHDPEYKPILLYDLQSASDCYIASKFYLDSPEVFIWLQGSGWKELGFPWNEPTFDPKDPYEHGEGKYAFIRGKAARKFIKIIEAEHLPRFNDISTGNITQDFCLDKQYVEEMSKEPPKNPKKARLFGSQLDMEDFLQLHKVFINGINDRKETCHMDSYGTIIDYQALDAAIKELEVTCQPTAEDWKPLVEGWFKGCNSQPPIRLVSLYIGRKYGIEVKDLTSATK